MVQAGVPSLMPEVTVGFSGSNGMPFLLQVMKARPSAASAALPDSFFGRRSTSMRWVSVPPDDVGAAFDHRGGKRFGIVHHLAGIGLELRTQRLAQGHRLGGNDMHQRTAPQAGEHR